MGMKRIQKTNSNIKQLTSVLMLMLCFLFRLVDAQTIPTLQFQHPNIKQIRLEDEVNDQQDLPYRIGVFSYAHVTTESDGIWTVNEQGQTVWQLRIAHPGAQALSFIFSNVALQQGAYLQVLSETGQTLSPRYVQEDVTEYHQLHIDLCKGDQMVLQFIQPASSAPSTFTLDQVVYNYRAYPSHSLEKINESESCEVNVNCSEGAAYQDEKKGIARIYIINSKGAFWCSGSLVNNLALTCKPYFLTALHCSAAQNTSLANMALWKFYFNYEASSCSNPTNSNQVSPTTISGCIRLVDSNDNTGSGTESSIKKSDFMLLQLGSIATESNVIATLQGIGAYWNGWDARDLASSYGVGIHHPAGDIKKISTYSSHLKSTSYGGQLMNSHWMVNWSPTANGSGVTEGGSSGSPLFTYNRGYSRIIGTLSGGASDCAFQNSYDLYGKFSAHWDKNGTTANVQLKTYLDPQNTGQLFMNGSYYPCIDTPDTTPRTLPKLFPNPTADFVTIEWENLYDETVQVKLLDACGNLMFLSESVNGAIPELDLQQVAVGVYFIEFIAPTDRYLFKIVKE